MAKPVPSDRDLDFLKHCTKEELDPLVSILLNANTNWLEIDENYKFYKPDHTKYVDAIIADYQTFGGNTVANTFRGYGVPYWEILKDVCGNQDVPVGDEKFQTMEANLLEKSLKGMWERLDEDQRRQIASEIGGSSFSIGGVGTEAMLAAFRMGGFASYKLTLMLVNGLVKVVLGRGLSFGANMALTKTLSIVTGPIGWAIGGLWTAVDIASPAYRVTVPATIYIAALRKMKLDAKVGEKVRETVQKGLDEGDYAVSDALGLNRAKNLQSSAGAKSEMMMNSGCGSRNVMFVLSQSGRNQYDVMQWLISHQFSTKFAQKRSVLKTSLPYDQAMEWKRELESLGATVEVS